MFELRKHENFVDLAYASRNSTRLPLQNKYEVIDHAILLGNFANWAPARSMLASTTSTPCSQPPFQWRVGFLCRSSWLVAWNESSTTGTRARSLSGPFDNRFGLFRKVHLAWWSTWNQSPTYCFTRCASFCCCCVVLDWIWMIFFHFIHSGYLLLSFSFVVSQDTRSKYKTNIHMTSSLVLSYEYNRTLFRLRVRVEHVAIVCVCSPLRCVALCCKVDRKDNNWEIVMASWDQKGSSN